MLISDFLLDIKGELRGYTSKLTPLFEKVIQQSLRHTTRSDMSELHQIARPSEDPAFVQWRKDNRRHLTVDFINQFVRMLQRIIGSTIKTDYGFKNLYRIVTKTIIPLSIQDPNCIIVLWPTIPNVDLPPNLNGDTRTALVAEHRIIYSQNIKEINDEMVIYFHDYVDLRVGSTDVPHQRYIGIDKQNYYLITPYYNEKKQLKYKEEVWYLHDFGMLPIAKVPGIETNYYFSDEIEPKTYNESLAWPAFENFDEGVVRLSSEQVASIKHANPKLVINGDIACPTCSGARFVNDGKDKTVKCGSCNGTGTIKSLGDFSTVNIQNGKGQFDKSHDNPLFYLEPPQGLEYLRKSWKEFFEDGKKALCNDLLEGTGTESGIAKEMRLEPKQDLMQSFGQSICWFMEDLVNFKRMIEGEKELITITPPAFYQTKSPDILKLELSESMQGERWIKYLQYIETIFKGDDVQIKIHKFAALYGPLMLYKADEIDSALNAGAYNEKDIIRRDMAVYAMTEIITFNPNIQLLEAKKQAEELLLSQGFLNDIKPINVLAGDEV